MEESCVICFLPLTLPVSLPQCGHIFCQSCISDWTARNPQCPCCRSPIIPPSPIIVDPPPLSPRSFSSPPLWGWWWPPMALLGGFLLVLAAVMVLLLNYTVFHFI